MREWLVSLLHRAAHPTHPLMDCPGLSFWTERANELRTDPLYADMIAAGDRVAAGEVWASQTEPDFESSHTEQEDETGEQTGEPEGPSAAAPARAGRAGRRGA